jgi:hypothetical protein
LDAVKAGAGTYYEAARGAFDPPPVTSPSMRLVTKT